MGRISELLAEVLASNYIKTIESLLSQFNWDDADIGFLDIKKSCYILINDISTAIGCNVLKYLFKSI
jgi:hypothetical protein